MSSQTTKDEPRSEAVNRIFCWLVVGLVGTVLIYALLVLALVGFTSKVSLALTGTFGDSFGVLTSLFSGLAFAGLIWTIFLQREELTLQREELKETRRQAIITRLCTVVQNQVAAYRSEIAQLKFRSINGLSEETLHEMLQSSSAHLEKLAADRESGDLSEEDHVHRIADYLKAVLNCLPSHQVLVGGLLRCCKSNRYLLTSAALDSEDASDLHSLFLSELPADLLDYVFQLGLVLTVYIAWRKRIGDSALGLSDPIRRLQLDCEMITEHRKLKLSDASLASDRKQKWLFRA